MGGSACSISPTATWSCTTTPTETATWNTGTAGGGAGQAILQSDGNFVVYDAQGNPGFFTGTGGNPNARLVLQDDGNIVIYTSSDQPVWDRIGGAAPAPSPTPGGTSVIDTGSASLASLTLLFGTFSTSAAGTIGVTTDWTFASNNIDIFLAAWTNPCSVDQFNNQECQFLGRTTSATTKPETLSVPNLAAGPYTLYMVNWGSTDDSVGYQITLTSPSGTSASPAPSTSVGGVKGSLTESSSSR